MSHRTLLPLAAALLCCSLAQAQPAGPYPGPGGMPMPGSGPGPAPSAGEQSAAPGVAYGREPMRPYRPMPGTPRGSAGREAAATVSAGLDKLFEFMADEAPNKLQTAAFLDREIAPYFDFAYMAQFVAGPDWQRMSSEQRDALAAQLESRILSGLATRLLKFSDEKVRYLRPRPGRRGSVDVRVGLLSPGTYPSQLVFRLYQSAEGWKVYDVIAEGRSLLAYYRNAFAQLTGSQPQMR